MTKTTAIALVSAAAWARAHCAPDRQGL